MGYAYLGLPNARTVDGTSIIIITLHGQTVLYSCSCSTRASSYSKYKQVKRSSIIDYLRARGRGTSRLLLEARHRHNDDDPTPARLRYPMLARALLVTIIATCELNLPHSNPKTTSCTFNRIQFLLAPGCAYCTPQQKKVRPRGALSLDDVERTKPGAAGTARVRIRQPGITPCGTPVG